MANHPLSAIPALHSDATASVKIYLDFDGYFEEDWWGPETDNDGIDENDSTQPVFDQDGDPATFSDAELAMIRDIWRRVADDFSPLNVDVTTVDPLDFSNGRGIRAAIKGVSHGGVAHQDAFINDKPNSVFASGSDASEAAGVVSQEVGHTLGLQHQTDPGTAEMRPIMYGLAGSGRNVWWLGATDSNPSFLQEDINILTRTVNGISLRADDHTFTGSLSTPLAASGYQMLSGGVIEETSDTDWFSFDVTGGTYTMHVDVVENLDAALELRDDSGNLIQQADPQGTAAVMTRQLAAGRYYLVVASHGEYGDIGQYTVGMEEGRLRIVSSEVSPTGVRVTFDKPVDPDSFDRSDVSHLNLPNWSIRVSVVPGTNNQTWDVTFSRPRTGGYRLEIGPNVLDVWGNAMDQDNDWNIGEAPGDEFVVEDFAGARIVDVTLSQPQSFLLPIGSILRNFRVPPVILATFSEAMDIASFTSNTIQISGPTGPVNLGSVAFVSSNSSGWTYSINLAYTPGSYQVTFGAGLTDLHGNQMDQDTDGQRGESMDDRTVSNLSVGAFASKPLQIDLDKFELWLRGGRSPLELTGRAEVYMRSYLGDAFGSFLKAPPKAVDAYFAALAADKPIPKDGPLPTGGRRFVADKEQDAWWVM